MIRRWTSRVGMPALLLLIATLIAAACSETSEPEEAPTTRMTSTTRAPAVTVPVAATGTVPPVTDPPGRPYGGEVIVADDQEPPTLNPYVPGGNKLIVSIVGQAYHAGVQDVDGFTFDFVPELVTELPTVANGGVVLNDDGTMTVNYNIIEEAVWSDGTPITGADFEFTLETILDPALPTTKDIYQDIVEWSAGRKTFSYTLAQPTLQFELLFNPIIPKHAVEGSDFTADWNDTMWPSAGPFVFDEWRKGEWIKLVRNENYWKKDPETGQHLPYLDSVVFRFIAESESIVNAFRAREVDVIQPPPLKETISALLELESEGADVEVLSGGTWEHLNFQFGENRFTKNPESVNENLNYRKGVAHAIDKELIVEEIFAGAVEPLDSFVDAFNPSISLGAWAQYDYNPEGARQFIEAAKAELGVDRIKAVFSTTENNDARVKMSELFVDMFTAVGIEYENQLEDSLIFFGETFDFGTWDLGVWAWIGAPGFADLVGMMDVFDPEAPPPQGQNYYRWGTPEVRGDRIAGFNQAASALIDDNSARFAEIRDALNSSVDQDELILLIQEAETILADQVIIVPLYGRPVTAAVWGDEVGGFKHNPTDASHTWNMEEWYRLEP